MKRTCLFIIFVCGTAIVACAQSGNDSTFHPNTTVNDSLKLPFQLLPANFYSTHLGFFCKKELQVEKAVKFPIKFRLGSVPYCDAMEGKRPVYGILPR